MTLAGKTAVVTGASRGIGQAIAQGLAQRGAKVIVNYAKDADGAAATVQAITTAGGEARALQADVADFKAAEGLIKAAVEAYGSLDILVNNAGTTRDMVIMLMPEADWDAVIQTNLKSAFSCSKAAVKVMMRKRMGRIINISSVSGISGNAGQTNYSAS
nr:SDR family NAD(P)-dependent oxidoreductase [Anaerolineales bacterium]